MIKLYHSDNFRTSTWFVQQAFCVQHEYYCCETFWRFSRGSSYRRSPRHEIGEYSCLHTVGRMNCSVQLLHVWIIHAYHYARRYILVLIYCSTCRKPSADAANRRVVVQHWITVELLTQPTRFHLGLGHLDNVIRLRLY